MATITLNASLNYNDGLINETVEQANFTYTPATGRQVHTQQSIPTTSGGTALNLGGLPSLGWALIRNLDSNNYVQVLTGSSGTVIHRIPPGGSWGPNYCDSGLQAPYLLANTAACLIEAELTAQ